MKRKAFTLVELLVVISIIAILLAVLIPSLNKARMAAKAVQCTSNMKQWGLVMMAYTMEYNGLFDLPGNYGDADNKDKSWYVTLYPFYKQMPDILFCTATAKDQSKNNSTDVTSNVWKIANNKSLYGVAAGMAGSVGKNSKLTSVPPQYLAAYNKDHDIKSNYTRIDEVRQGNTVPLFFDAMHVDTSFATSNGYVSEPPPYKGADPFNTSIAGHNASWRAVINRHGSNSDGATVMVFVDGSARKVYLKETYKLKWNKLFDTRAYLPSKWPKWMQSFRNFGMTTRSASKNPNP
jgi:prepilin-type N-terminal cleavage/methylation domain-containing protein